MKRTNRILSLLLVLSMLVGMFAVTAGAAPAADITASVTAGDLQVEYMTQPLGLDETAPRFSWTLDSDARGVTQESYRLVVATSEANLANGPYVWDTGVVKESTTFGVTYAGEALQATTRYYWQVTSTTNQGTASAQSWFETGLMNGKLEAWDGAEWITDPADVTVDDVDNYTVEWDFAMVKDGASLRFAADGTYSLVWQFNINPVERPYGGTPYFRPHAWAPGGACLEDIKIDHVIPDNETGKHAWYHCKVVVTKTGSTYYATTSLGPVDGDMTVIDENRALPSGHDWSVGKLGFRQITDPNNQDDGYFDNIKIIDNTNNAVIYQEAFDAETVPAMFQDNGTIENGTYHLGGMNYDFTSDYRVVDADAVETDGGGEPLFRKSFTVDPDKTVASARLYATARGVYEFSLNGEKVGDQFLAPGWTDYTYTLMYQTYDITDMLRSGENVVGAMLGQGWWSSPEQGASYAYTYGETQSLLGKLVVTYTDGSKETVVTNDTWLSHAGPVIYADNYAGEDYDARYDCAGWNTPGYDTTGWKAAGIEEPMKDSVNLVAQTGEPIREVGRFSDPVMTEPVEGRLTFDFGQNISGFVRIKVKGEAGTKVTIKHAEMLNTETAYKKNGTSVNGGDDLPGTIYRANLRDSFARGKQVAIDTYTLKGDENGETWMPTFTFHGFRYVEVTGISADQILSIEAIAISSDNEITSTFESSSSKINQLFSNVIWGMRGNFVSVPTDCPNRDERLGYTGDTQIFAGTGVYMANSNQFYSKWLRDLRDYQLNETSGIAYGKVPVIIPMNNWTGGWPSNWSSAWGNAAVIVPWQLYQQYGDTQIIADAYESMKAWCDFQMDPDRTTDYLRKGSSASGGDNNYGDWLAVEESDKSLTNTLYMAYDFRTFSTMARVIGKTDVADEYEATCKKIVAAIMNKWGDENGDLIVNTQTPLALFLHFGLAEMSDTANAKLIAKRLMENVEAHGWKLTTGFIGVNALLPALSENGQMEAALRLLEQEDYPSWLYSVNQGATTTWERWNSFTLDNGFGNAGMNSFNHYAYGAVGEWMMSGALGIRRDEANPGFTHFNLDPQYGGSLTYAKGSYDSVSGKIEAGWTLDADTGAFTYTVKVPANTTATLSMPAGSADAVLESGKAAAEAEGVSYVRYDADNGRAVYELASGSYTFTANVGVKHNVTLSADLVSKAMGPVQAIVTVNGESKTMTLPTALSEAEGTEVTVQAVPMNNVDYTASGWTANGETVSATDTMTFTVTGDAAYTVGTAYVGVTSLAKGKSVTANAVNGDWKAANLTDGILCSEGGTNGWSSPMQGHDMTFAEVTAVIDLGSKTTFNQARLYPRYIAGYGAVNCPTAYTIYTSDDNQNWTVVYSTTNGSVTNGYAPVVIDLENEVSARYVKLGVTGVNRGDESNTAYVQLSEMGLYYIGETVHEVTLNVQSDSADAVPMSAVVEVNGKQAADTLPVTLAVKTGDKITVTAELLNDVDYALTGWTDGEAALSQDGTLTYTVDGEAALTLNAKWIGLDNLAQGKTVTAAAVNGDWAAANLTDGKLSYLGGTNGWSSGNQGKATTFNEVSAVIDLGEETQFNRLQMYPRNLPSQKEDVGVMNCPTAYTIYVSNDNQNWTAVYSTAEGAVTNGFAPVVIDLEQTASARYVKLGVTAVNHGDENGDVYVQLSELGIYMVPVVSEDVELIVTGEEEVSVTEGTVSYTVSAKNMNRLATAALTFQVSQETLTNPVAEAAGEGWFIIVQSYENGVLNVVMAAKAGASGEGDLLKITAQSTGKAGEATLTLTKADLAAYEGEGEKFVPANLDKASAATNVTLNVYDVNRDGQVDLLDITRAQRYYGTDDAICDVNHDGEVNISDLILILNNFTVEY